MKCGDGMELKCLRDCPEIISVASRWFASKWPVPEEAYHESMKKCGERNVRIPQWYVVLNERRKIIAGAGIVENDFHDRPDLTPNLCALFVEEEYRGRGIAKYILDFARRDVGALGFSKLYLVTDHAEFYEKCGWELLTVAPKGRNVPERMYAAPAE